MEVLNRPRRKRNQSVEMLCRPSEGRTGDRKHDFAYDKERRQQRQLQEAGVAWLCDLDTPEARMFAGYVANNMAADKKSQRQARAAGDPLNLTGHSPRPSKKQQRKTEEQARVARGERRDLMPDLDSPNQNVLVTTLSHSFRRVKQLKIHHQAGAERFVADWESAYYSGLRSQDFEPRVDSSPKAHVGHLRAIEAQKRLGLLKAEVGQRNFEICQGVLIYNANATLAHKLGGRDHRSVNHDIDVALNALAGFYDPVRLARDPTWQAFQLIIERGKVVIESLEKDVLR